MEEQFIYVIVHTARTGSHLLASWLNSVGLGQAEEFLTNVSDKEGRLKQLLRQSGGILAIKGWLDDVSHVWANHPGTKIIWLRRGDKLRQAISYYRAVASGVWRLGPSGNVPFDATSIASALSMFSCQESRMERELGPLLPLRVWYEDLVAQPTETISRIAAYLGRSVDVSKLTTPLRPMADETTDRWVEHFGSLSSLGDSR